jgi:hypothetical protein
VVVTVMGRSHAASGAAGWLVACAAAAAVGHRPAFTTVVVGAVVAAGFAVAPDADHPQATVSRVLGPVSQWAAGWVAYCCAWLHAETATRRDAPRRNGHRTASHTAAAGLAAGWVVAEACAVVGRWAVAAVVFVAAGLAARSLFSRRARGDFGATLAGLAAAGMTCWTAPAHAAWWWLGVPVAFGWLAHLTGDALTNSGCPILWPLMIRRRHWYPVGTPRALRFRAGDAWEQMLVVPAITVAGLASAGWLLATL